MNSMPIPQRTSLPVVVHLPDSSFPTGYLNNTERQKMAAGEARFQKIMQPIVRTVRDFSFVHCYLACGHMITMAKDDLKESPPSIECWACEDTIKQGHPSK